MSQSSPPRTGTQQKMSLRSVIDIGKCVEDCDMKNNEAVAQGT
jgi:hypothetical protein